MAFRLKLVPEHTAIDFFRAQKITFGISTLLAILSVVVLFTNGLNFGIDFRGGTTIRTESSQPVDVAAYRAALSGMDLGDVAITEVFDPGFRADQHVAQVRIGAQDGVEAVSPDTIRAVEAALQTVDPSIDQRRGGVQGERLEDSLAQQTVIARPARPFDDQAQQDVVGVRIMKAFPRGEQRRPVEYERDQRFG
ncbi:MAG: hypothetical protein LPJ95_01740, partial [Paracoccaceae bacterium]|nr:hypothetical protein [Paracoccaceae bacterium]